MRPTSSKATRSKVGIILTRHSIVFVHGFTGHPEKTWKQKRGTDQAHDSKRSRFLPNLSSHAGRSTSSGWVFWPRDLLPSAVPRARILTYGYDTRIRCGLEPKNNNTVNDIGRNFLVALEAERRPSPTRPVVFICHSLGGIVVKEMLRQSFGSSSVRIHLRDVYTSTVGLIFFGTPHGGADPRGFLHHVLQRLAGILTIRMDEKIFNELLPSSARLKELREEFNPKMVERQWIIHSFQEADGVPALNGVKVVDDVSSYLNLPTETTEHILKDHMEMCRFSGPDDQEYKKVVAALQRIVSAVKEVDPTASQDDADLRPVEKLDHRELMDSLAFDEMDSRHDNIKRAHAKTCKWLLQKDEYVWWLDPTRKAEHFGILWIKGKPGAGKSTLMKYALAQAKRSLKGSTVLRFFFHARGTQLEKTTFGMYRSLLHQLLSVDPSLLSVFDGPCFTSGTKSAQRLWSVEVLKEVFSLAIQSSPGKRITCFLDALDECDEAEIRDMISFFERVSEVAVEAGVDVLFCFASRHYPHITMRNGLSLVVEGQEEHGHDISHYLDSELRIGHSALAEAIREEIRSKAQSVFLWVVLVVQILNKEYDGGRIKALRRRLKEIPSNLHHLFRDILTRDSRNPHALLLCIQWVLFAKRPLSPSELYCAVQAGIETNEPDDMDIEDLSEDDIGRFVLDSSKGLVEITRACNRQVQFIHESVKDYLHRSNGLSDVWNGGSGNFEGSSHDILKSCCVKYARFCNDNDLPHKAGLAKASARTEVWKSRYPFLDYTIRYTLSHADEAQEKGVDQTQFLDGFPLDDWLHLCNQIAKFSTRQYPPGSSIFQLFAEHDTPHLMRVYSPASDFVHRGGDDFENAYIRALYSGSCRFVEEILRLAAIGREGAPDPCMQEIHDVFVQHGTSFPAMKGRRHKKEPETLLFDMFSTDRPELCMFWMLQCSKYFWSGPLKFSSSDVRTALGQSRILFFILDFALESPETSDMPNSFHRVKNGLPRNLQLYLGQYALELAIRNRMPSLSAEIASRYSQIDIEEKTVDGMTLLHLLVKENRENEVRSIVSLATKEGAVDGDSGTKRLVDLNRLDWAGMTPLHAAAQAGLAKIADTLIQAGAEIDHLGRVGYTPLQFAIKGNHEAVVRLLLGAGAEINRPNQSGETPLHSAVKSSNEAAICLLLAAGSDPSREDESGCSPLSLAMAFDDASMAALIGSQSASDVGVKEIDGIV
jgi:ankyrin repeat protein